jgi:hypothetical protein
MRTYDLEIFQIEVSKETGLSPVPNLGDVRDCTCVLKLKDQNSTKQMLFELPVLQTLWMLLGVVLQMPLKGDKTTSTFVLLDYAEMVELTIDGDQVLARLDNGIELGQLAFVDFARRTNEFLLHEYRLAKIENRLDESSPMIGRLTLPVLLNVD